MCLAPQQYETRAQSSYHPRFHTDPYYHSTNIPPTYKTNSTRNRNNHLRTTNTNNQHHHREPLTHFPTKENDRSVDQQLKAAKKIRSTMYQTLPARNSKHFTPQGLLRGRLYISPNQGSFSCDLGQNILFFLVRKGNLQYEPPEYILGSLQTQITAQVPLLKLLPHLRHPNSFF